MSHNFQMKYLSCASLARCYLVRTHSVVFVLAIVQLVKRSGCVYCERVANFTTPARLATDVAARKCHSAQAAGQGPNNVRR